MLLLSSLQDKIRDFKCLTKMGQQHSDQEQHQLDLVEQKEEEQGLDSKSHSLSSSSSSSATATASDFETLGQKIQNLGLHDDDKVVDEVIHSEKEVVKEMEKEKGNLDEIGRLKENGELKEEKLEEKVNLGEIENLNKEKVVENPEDVKDSWTADPEDNWKENGKENVKDNWTGYPEDNWKENGKEIVEDNWNENRSGNLEDGWKYDEKPNQENNWNENGEDYFEDGWKYDEKASVEDNWYENGNMQGETEVEENKKLHYPLRPGEPNCSYYLRTGSCRYGLNCRYNHPTRRKNKVRSSSADSAEPVQAAQDKEEHQERSGQIECKYYLRAGGCKYGKSCRYDHSREKAENEPAVEFNFLGLPIRPGERECPFYMRTGSCKFATNCRFHHPDPTAAGVSDPGYDRSSSVQLRSSGESQTAVPSWSLPRPSNAVAPYLDTSPSYMPMMLSPPGGLQSTEWNGYQAPPIMPIYLPKGNVRPSMAASMNDSTRTSDGFTHQQQITVDEYPERPGQKECQYFMKTGDCKYRSACRFHHPKNRVPNSPALSPMGLPLRPDQIICTHYGRYGICKFGPACKYDHPPNHGAPAFPGSPPTPMPSDSSATFGGPGMADYGDGTKALVQQSV